MLTCWMHLKGAASMRRMRTCEAMALGVRLHPHLQPVGSRVLTRMHRFSHDCKKEEYGTIICVLALQVQLLSQETCLDLSERALLRIANTCDTKLMSDSWAVCFRIPY